MGEKIFKTCLDILFFYFLKNKIKRPCVMVDDPLRRGSTMFYYSAGNTNELRRRWC